MIVYKLTNSADRTHGSCQWGSGVVHKTSGKGELCGPGWLHAYEDPLIAVFMNPVHGDFNPDTMHLWRCEAGGEIKRDGQLKLGCTQLTTIEQIEVPKLTLEQRITIAILAAKKAYHEFSEWLIWADKWLSGENRSAEAANAAARSTVKAPYAATQSVRVTEAASAAFWAASTAVEVVTEAELDLIAIVHRTVETPKPGSHEHEKTPDY